MVAPFEMFLKYFRKNISERWIIWKNEKYSKYEKWQKKKNLENINNSENYWFLQFLTLEIPLSHRPKVLACGLYRVCGLFRANKKNRPVRFLFFCLSFEIWSPIIHSKVDFWRFGPSVNYIGKINEISWFLNTTKLKKNKVIACGFFLLWKTQNGNFAFFERKNEKIKSYTNKKWMHSLNIETTFEHFLESFFGNGRDFSRFSEDRPTPHVVDFWPVTSVVC